MKRAFSQIFWGLIFILVDLRINRFDVVPDWIGCVLVLAGLSKLRSRNTGFQIAWAAAWAQLILTLLPLFGIRTEISLTSGERPELGTLGWISLALAVELVLFYGICEGIRTLALEQGKASMASYAKALWNWNFALGAITLISLPFHLNNQLLGMWPLLLLLALGSFLTMLLLIILVRRAGRELAAAPPFDLQ